MEDNENSANPLQKIYEMYAAGQAAPLDDIYSVENVATDIKEMEHKIEFYNGLKKKRIEEIDNSIKALSNKIVFYKTVITKTLLKWKEKTVNFPGICKISTRNSSAVWDIQNEEEFVKRVIEAGEKDKIIEEVHSYKIIKKEANKLLADWEKAGNIPEGVLKIIKDPSVSITFYEQTEEPASVIDDDPVPMKEPVFDKLSL